MSTASVTNKATIVMGSMSQAFPNKIQQAVEMSLKLVGRERFCMPTCSFASRRRPSCCMIQVLDLVCSKIRFSHQRRDSFEFEEEHW